VKREYQSESEVKKDVLPEVRRYIDVTYVCMLHRIYVLLIVGQ
jgi:hypothetical protein